MSTEKYIKGFCIGRQSDSKILFKVNRHQSEQIEDDIEKHIQKYFKVDEEQKQFEINKTHETISHNGVYYTLIDDKFIVYSTLISELYPSNQAQTMLNRIKKELKNMPNYQKQTEKSIKNFAQGFIISIVDEFDSDKIVQDSIKAKEQEAQQKQIEMEDLQIQIEQNLKQLNTDHNNPSNFSTADQKLSPELEKLRQQQEIIKEEQNYSNKEFNRQEVEKMQKKQLSNAVKVRNLKIKIIVCIVIIAVGLYLVIPLF